MRAINFVRLDRPTTQVGRSTRHWQRSPRIKQSIEERIRNETASTRAVDCDCLFGMFNTGSHRVPITISKRSDSTSDKDTELREQA